jgi:DNA-binding MarR family transcriptional regulator
LVGPTKTESKVKESHRLAALPTWLLSRTETRSHRLLHDRLSEAGFTGYQYRVLATLADSGRQSQADVGRAVSLDRRDVTHTVRELEERGLVERRPHPTHGRIVMVALTEDGRGAIQAMDAVMQTVQDEVCADLTAAERRELVRLLSKMTSTGTESTGISERDRLQHFLDEQRSAVLDIIDGLDEAQLRTEVLPSGWSPIGMIQHLTGAEASWFERVILGVEPERQWEDGIEDPPYDPKAPFVTLHANAAVIEAYRAQCRISNAILKSHELDAPLLGEHGLDWPDEPITDVRWVVLHMIEETARHAGHLDAARELLDGVTGRGPR